MQTCLIQQKYEWNWLKHFVNNALLWLKFHLKINKILIKEL